MKTVMKYYGKYLPWIILTFALLVVQAFSDLALPEYMANIIKEGVAVGDMHVVWKCGLIMLGYSGVVMACAIAVGYLAAYIGAGASKRIRADLFDKVSNFSNAEFDKFTVSSLITRSTNDVTQVQMFSIMLIRMALYAPVIAVGGIIKAVKTSSGVGSLGIVIAVAVGIVLITIVVLMVVVQPKVIKLQKLIDKVNLVAREGLNGMMVVRAFNTQQHEEARFDQANKELTDVNLFVNRVMSALMPVIMMVMNGVSIAVVWVVAYTAADITQITNMMAFVQYAVQIIMAFMMVTMVFILAPRAVVSARRIQEVLLSPVSVVNRPGAVNVERVTGEVAFNDVSFKYGESEEDVLSHIDFTAKPGEVTAIIGATGSGKSSIINLIPRLYDVSEGSVTIDGTDVRDMTLESLRKNVAFIPQKNVLFSGTIGSNIKYADETAGDGEMKQAAEIAQATEFIDTKPEGYDSEIAQGGVNVSGGQKQRLAIARAVMKKAPVYVFDDSFSALDFKTDANLRRALNENLKDSTMIIVAQRVGTIMNADQILVVDEGQIVGKGKHKELMETCPVYADIARSQLSQEELAR